MSSDSMWSARFVIGSAHRPRSGCDYPTAASSIVLQNDSEEVPFLLRPTRSAIESVPVEPGAPCFRQSDPPLLLDTRRSWPNVGSAELASHVRDPSPPGLPVATGELVGPSVSRGRAPHGLLDCTTTKGLLEGLGSRPPVFILGTH